MDRALWLLLWLRLWGWERRLRKNLRSVKGALLACAGLLLVFPCLFSVFLTPRPEMTSEQLATVRLYGPLALLAYCLLTVLFSSGERAVSFSPAEVNLLFAGPFSRRQLLAYKIVAGFATSLLSAVVFLLAFLRVRTPFLVGGYLGFVLGLWFVQLLAMLLVLLATTIGVQAYNRRRRLTLFVLALVLVAAVLSLGRDAWQLPPRDLAEEMARAPLVRAFLLPLQPIVEVFTAERLWPDLVQWTVLGLLANGTLLAVVIALDAQYLESAAAASERLYARLQQVRAGGAAALGLRSTGKVRLRLPALPWWGGIGPIAWRQLVTAPRTRGPLMFVLILFGPVLVAGLNARADANQENAYPLVLAGTVIGMTIFLTPTIAFDFRGDVDRMDILKTLPIASFALVIGQLVAPVLIISVLQWVALAVIGGVGRQAGPWLGTMAALVLPFNALLLGIENLLFLWFPTRLAATTPGDFQALGRHMLLMLAKSIGLVVAGGLAALLGVLAYLLTGGNWLAGVLVAWLVLVGCAIALMPLLALAFRQFDVARDTPP